MKKAVIDEILEPGTPDKVLEREQCVRDGFWEKLKKTAGKLPFVEDVVAGYYCALDPETPFKVRGTLLAALAYFIMPVDLVPDFIVGLGLSDDITVLTIVIARIREHMTEAHREAARKALQTHDVTDQER
jgi:uncharacterized membrane protein YkvA (DUF1232 family)